MNKKICYGQIGRLKRNKIKTYKYLHENPWPEVLETIKKCNLQNYSIFIQDDIVFAYFEYVGEDYEADMKNMEKCKHTLEWWKHTKPCFVLNSFSQDSLYYNDMQQIFFME